MRGKCFLLPLRSVHGRLLCHLTTVVPAVPDSSNRPDQSLGTSLRNSIRLRTMPSVTADVQDEEKPRS